jgi:hypothetical protein
MNEYMFFIRKKNEESLPPEKFEQFLNECEVYIENLKSQGVLISAQPVDWDGRIISGKKDKWKESPYNESEEVIAGYYHLLANDIDEATDIAKTNPEFTYFKNTRIEVRPVKMKEDQSGFVYPSESV